MSYPFPIKLLIVLCCFFPSPVLVWAGSTRLVPSLGVAGEYNDNILYSDQKKRGDYIARLSPGILMDHRTQRLESHLSAEAEAIHYRENTDLNGTNQYYDGFIKYGFHPKLSGSLQGGYTIDTQIDRDLDTTGLLLTNATRDRIQGSIGADVATTENATTELDYKFLQDTFDDPNLSDSQTHDVSLSLNHDLQKHIPHLQGRMRFAYTHYEYQRNLDVEIDSIPAAYDETTLVDNYAIAVGGVYDWNEVLNLLVDLGARFTEIDYLQEWTLGDPQQPIPDGSESQKETSRDQAWAGTGEIKLRHQAEKGHLEFGFANDLKPASGQNSPSARSDCFLRLSRRFSQEFRASLYTVYFVNNTGINPLDLQTWESQTFQVRPSLHFEINDNLSLRVYYSYTMVIRHETANDAHRNVLFAQIVGQYPILE